MDLKSLEDPRIEDAFAFMAATLNAVTAMEVSLPLKQVRIFLEKAGVEA